MANQLADQPADRVRTPIPITQEEWDTRLQQALADHQANSRGLNWYFTTFLDEQYRIAIADAEGDELASNPAPSTIEDELASQGTLDFLDFDQAGSEADEDTDDEDDSEVEPIPGTIGSLNEANDSELESDYVDDTDMDEDDGLDEDQMDEESDLDEEMTDLDFPSRDEPVPATIYQGNRYLTRSKVH